MEDHDKEKASETLLNTQQPVMIIGSGCTGLAIAQGLRKAGIPVIVLEKKPALLSPGDRDWNMGLHWAYPTLLSLLPENAIKEIQSVQVDPNTPTKETDTLIFLHGQTGKEIRTMDVHNFYRLRRSKLRGLLARGVDIRFSHTLTNIIYNDNDSVEKSVTAIFANGEKVTGRCLIGCDGARSQVRTLLLDPEKALSTRLPYSATFVQARYTAPQALFLRSFHPLYIAATHPHNTFAFFGLQDAPSTTQPEEWTFFFYISWASTSEEQDEERKMFGKKERLEQVRNKAKEYCEPWESAFEWLKGDEQAWNFDLSVWDPSLGEHAWDGRGGRVTLAGDAAHAMTYQRGQGLNHSLTDAGHLVSALTSTLPPPSSPTCTSTSSPISLEQAISTYETEMKARTGEEVRVSVMNTAMLHDWNQVLESPVFRAGLKLDSGGS